MELLFWRGDAMKKFGMFLVALCCFSLFAGCTPEDKKPADKPGAGATKPADTKPAPDATKPK